MTTDDYTYYLIPRSPLGSREIIQILLCQTRVDAPSLADVPILYMDQH